MTVGATGTITESFVLAPGGRIAGQVTAQDTGLPITGVEIAVHDWDTNAITFNADRFRIQLYKGLYTVIARGKQLSADSRTTATGVSFNAYANAQPVTVKYGATPLSDVKVILRSATDSLGNATVCAATNATAKLAVRVDDGGLYATQVYNGIYNAVSSGTSVPMTVAGSNVTNANIPVAMVNTANLVTGRVTYTSGGVTYGVPNATMQLLDSANTANVFESFQADNDGY